MNTHSDAAPAPVPDRVLLPAPDSQEAEQVLTWVMSSGELAWSMPGRVMIHHRYRYPDEFDALERDALATLAAVRWARGEQS